MNDVDSRNSTDSQADRLLAEACQLADRDAQRRLYEQYSDRIYRLMIRMVGNQEADDLTQQVFLQVYRKIHLYSGKSRLGTWLFRVAVNEALQYRRRFKKHENQPLHTEPATASDSSADYEKRELIERALSGLEPELRSIFLLRELEQMSYAQISEVLGIPEGTVASRLNRARSALKDELARLAS